MNSKRNEIYFAIYMVLLAHSELLPSQCVRRRRLSSVVVNFLEKSSSQKLLMLQT